MPASELPRPSGTATAAVCSNRRPGQKRHSLPEGFGKIFRAPFQFGAARQLREESFEGPAIVSGHQFIRLAVQQQFAFVNDDDTMANAFHDVQNMGTVNDGLALASQGLNQGFKTDSGVGIQPVERLVEKNDRADCAKART